MTWIVLLSGSVASSSDCAGRARDSRIILLQNDTKKQAAKGAIDVTTPPDEVSSRPVEARSQTQTTAGLTVSQ